MSMKMVGITEEMYNQLNRISETTGMLKYRVVGEALDLLEEKYKEKIQKYIEKNHE